MRKLRKSFEKKNVDKIKYNFYVFDTETTCLEPMQKNFVFGVIYGFNWSKVIYTIEEFIEEFGKEKYKGKYLYAHNAEFDLLTIFGNIFLKIDTAAIFNGKFISAKYKDLIFADSMNIFPTSVSKLGELLGLPKLENKKAADGRLRKSNVTADDIDYCMRDCEIVYKSLLKIFEMTGAIKITLPSLAMFEFRHSYLEKDLYFSELVDEFYESYYGGRTEAFYIGYCKAKVFDVNSMYPSVMRNMYLPDVKSLKKVEKCDEKFLLFCLDHYEGMAKVTVEHKETFFGYLPCRAELNNTKKLVFPVGEFTTTVNFNELRFAVKSNVVKILKVHYLIYANPIKSIFTSYIDSNYEKRKASTNDLERTIYKLKMNSLYGRFAMRMKMTTTYYEQVPFKLITELKECEKYCDVKLFNAIRADCFLITENEKFKNSFFSIPTLSSYITSEARLMLLKTLLRNEKNNVVYCDTDSVFLVDNFAGNISDNLGDWKLEEKIVTRIRGLKNYAYEQNGETFAVIKGISRGCKKEKTDRYGQEIYASQRYIKTKASFRRGLEAGQSYILTKTVSNNYDKREVLQDGTTKPLISKAVGTGLDLSYKLINSVKFIRPKKINGNKIVFNYEPQNIRESVIMFFIGGGKIYTKDLIDHVTGSSKEELKSYKGLHSMDGIHMDIFCETVPEGFYTDRIIDVFQDVLLDFNNVSAMIEHLRSRKIAMEERNIENFSEFEHEYDTPF
jgi:hypothetical protein